MKTLLLVSIIASIGISFTSLVFVYQHIQNCDAQGGLITGFLMCSKSEYQVLLEKKEPFVMISLDGFNHAQAVGSPLDDFTIKLEGYYPRYNPPDIVLKDEYDNTVWTNYDDISHNYETLSPFREFCNEYKFNEIGGPLTINKTGTYKFIFSFEGFSTEQELLIRQSTSGVTLDRPDFHCP
jgi:hypothetical protein